MRAFIQLFDFISEIASRKVADQFQCIQEEMVDWMLQKQQVKRIQETYF